MVADEMFPDGPGGALDFVDVEDGVRLCSFGCLFLTMSLCRLEMDWVDLLGCSVISLLVRRLFMLTSTTALETFLMTII